MKYLKKFNEDFAMLNNREQMEGFDAHKNCVNCEKPTDFCDCEKCDNCHESNCICDEAQEEFNEKKKIPAGLQAYLDKKAGKKGKKGEEKEEKEDNKADKKGKKGDEKEEKAPKGKGLTAAQKKLPPALQKAILAKKK